MAHWPAKVSWSYEHTHRGARLVKSGTCGLAVTDTKAEGLALVASEIERMREWVLERSPNSKTVITITLDADEGEA